MVLAVLIIILSRSQKVGRGLIRACTYLRLEFIMYGNYSSCLSSYHHEPRRW